MDVGSKNLNFFPNTLDHPSFTKIEEFCNALVTTLNALESAIRQLHPPALAELSRAIVPFGRRFKDAQNIFFKNSYPEKLQPFLKHLTAATDHTQAALDGLINASDSPDLSKIVSSISRHCRAQELIYPFHPMIKPISRYFLEAPFRQQSDTYCANESYQYDVGLKSLPEAGESPRKCYLYVPESYDGSEALPLVIALHGGSGSGKEFIWSWVREARTRRFVLMSPSSADRTWSFNSNHDFKRITSWANDVIKNYNISRENVLLTGFSDGAIYALTCGLMEESPFTNLAPISGILHPQHLKNAKDRRIYMVHGAKDWMFPIQHAESAYNILKTYGADIVFQKINNLSHTYPREENDRILKWFNPGLSLKAIKGKQQSII